MKEPMRILVFGDQSNDFASGLRLLLRAKDKSLLTSFFEKANFALRQEVSTHPRQIQELLPRFSSVSDLLAQYTTRSQAAPVLESTLTTLYQLGCLIGYYEEPSRPWASTSSHCVVLGMCTGLLAASAAACAATVAQLVPLAVEAVVVAFRTGLHVTKIRNLLEPPADTLEPWSFIVLDMQLETICSHIDSFCKDAHLPMPSRPFVSAVGPSSVTVSGPPRTLKRFLTCSSMASHKALQVSIHAPYHANHLHTASDVDSILASLSETVSRTEARLPVISSETGLPIPSGTFHTLLQISLAEILMKPIRWDQVVKLDGTAWDMLGESACIIHPVGSNAVQSLTAALHEQKGARAQVQHLIDMRQIPSSVASKPSGRPDQSKIAIIGYSGRFPEAADPYSLWALLHEGRDVHRKVPPNRFNVETHYDSTGKKKNTSQVQYGCFINDPGLFDSGYFNLSPKEADQSDPGQRLALLTAVEALEMAGIVPGRTPSTQRDRVGIFYGMTSDDWREVNSGQDIGTYFIPGGNRAFTPGRINYHFKFLGPSISVDTACSSSAAAIHMACNSLWRNDCDMAIAGGTNVMTNPDNFTGLDKGHFLSRTGSCKTFDDGADGYCRADAVGTVILKRLEDALTDKDPIQAVIVNAYTNHSAEAESITRPHTGAQSFIFRKLLNDSGHDPADVTYIEMHGTGTQTGDATEMRSVLEVFAGPHSARAPSNPLFLGSVKANVGHAESASGVTSLIKVLLMMKNHEIPPHCGIKTKLNTKFPADLADRGIRIAMRPTPWVHHPYRRRMAFLNNFSAAGGNSALLLEDAPAEVLLSQEQDPRTRHVVAVSAKTPRSLQRNIQALVEHLKRLSDADMGSLSYTTTARRMHHKHRLIVSGGDMASIRAALENELTTENRPIARNPPKIAFAFTGQGSQYLGMGRQLWESFGIFREELLKLDQLARHHGFESILPLIDGTAKEMEGLRPQMVQLGQVCLQIALARLWIAFGVTPSLVVGHSLGEYAALHIAGVLSASDAVYLTGKRAQLLEQQCIAGTHAMLAVRQEPASLTSLMAQHELEIACINGPAQTVIAGPLAAIDAAQASLTTSGVKSTKLNTSFAFHSAQVDPILEKFRTAAKGAVFQPPVAPILSPLLATVLTNQDELNAEYLIRHCRETVDFAGALHAANQSKLLTESTIWLEVGPDTVVSGMIKACLGSSAVTTSSLRQRDDMWVTLSESLSVLYSKGVDIRWDEYHRDFDRFHKVLELPSYQWDYRNHWIQYVNDWCLTKGEPATTHSSLSTPSPPQLWTATCQRIVQQQHGSERSSVTIESDIARPELQAVFEAHRVNGAALCPSSVYADIAMTLGDFLGKDNPRQENTGIDVASMVTSKPLLMRTPGQSELFRVTAVADWPTQTAQVSYYSVGRNGNKAVEHATCTVRFGNPQTWREEWNRLGYLVQSRIRDLESAVLGGRCHRIKRGMVYKLFENCVEYGDKFRGIEEVVLDSQEHEAMARVKFQDREGNFFANPYYIDSLGHLSGFVMNATETCDYRTHVFINHGWQSIRCSARLSPDETYQTYVKMHNLSDSRFSGDVYIFQGGKIIGLNQGVSFQAVPRRVLDMLLPNPSLPTSRPVAQRITSVRPAQSERQESLRVESKNDIVSTEKTITRSTVILQALGIIAEEVGLNMSEIRDDMDFADMGVDSLLSLTITGRFREDLETDVSSHFFMDYPTVKDMKIFFGGIPPSSTQTTSSPSLTPSFDGVFSDPSVTSDDDDHLSNENEMKQDASRHPISAICSIIAEEVGVTVEEVWNAQELADLGLDSLLSLTVLGRLREELDIDLPSDIFFESNMSGIRDRLQQQGPQAETTPLVQQNPSHAPPNLPPASSIVLQGSLRTATKILFLLPDGSGSATSYATLARVAPDVAVIGLNCPFMKTPQDLNCTLHDLTAPYLAEIRRRQPNGPYTLGGWSAGGISAFDAAQVLIAAGEQVSDLILLDSPNPIGLAKLPPRMYHFLNGLNMFGAGDAPPPEWLLPHFLAFVDALAQYQPKPFTAGQAPVTHIIWAADGVYRTSGGKRLEAHPDDTREMRWLLEDRTDFGPNGWDQLVGRDRLRIEVLANANHFTMMEGERSLKLSRFLARAMGVCQP